MEITTSTGKLFGQPAIKVTITGIDFTEDIVLQPEPDTTNVYAIYAYEGYGLEYVHSYEGTSKTL